MNDFPRRQPDRSISARRAEVPPLALLGRLLSALHKVDVTERSGALVPAGPVRHEVPRTAADCPRVPGYPVPDALSPHASRYAATMRRVSLATGTTGLGEYWQQPGVFAVAPDGSGRFWQGLGFTPAGGAR